MYEHNGFHQAFSYFSTISANSLFSRKATTKSKDSFVVKDTSLSSLPPLSKISLDDDEEDDDSPFTSRSNSNITISSLLNDDDNGLVEGEEEEPWKLLFNKDIQYQNKDYFFMDRQDLHNRLIQDEER
jgi:hypothetical protein